MRKLLYAYLIFNCYFAFGQQKTSSFFKGKIETHNLLATVWPTNAGINYEIQNINGYVFQAGVTYYSSKVEQFPPGYYVGTSFLSGENPTPRNAFQTINLKAGKIVALSPALQMIPSIGLSVFQFQKATFVPNPNYLVVNFLYNEATHNTVYKAYNSLGVVGSLRLERIPIKRKIGVFLQLDAFANQYNVNLPVSLGVRLRMKKN